MAKNRRKKRRKRRDGQAPVPQPPRPSRARSQGAALRPDAVAASATFMPHQIGDVVSATVTDFRDDGGLSLDVDGLVGIVPLGELNLADSESAQDRYAIGETIEGLFVWGSDHEFRLLALSAKRNAPGYVDALQRRTVGDVVEATVTDFQDNGGITLDVDGLVGGVPPWELALADRESAQERYTIGERIDGLFVWQVNRDEVDRNARVLFLSAKRDEPGYVESLQQRTVGDIVSGTITGIADNSLWLDVNGLVGLVLPWELDLAEGESAQERYTVGETIEGLFVWGVNHETREIYSSLKRNTPGYVEALQRRTIGEVVSGKIIERVLDVLTVDVDGVVGVTLASELPLEAERLPQQRYSVDDTIAARVWMIDPMSRTIFLSARRHAADFRAEPVAQGAIIDAVVQGTTPRGVRMPIRVLTTYSDSSVEIPPHALSLSVGMPPRFEDNQVIRVVVVELDDAGRPTRLSHQQALDGWETEMRQLLHNTVVPNARLVPPDALSDAERRAGAAAVDLGPIIGVVPEEELNRETGQHIATYNETYRVVVKSVDYERRIAVVSHEQYEERWRAVAAQLELDAGAEVEGELRDFDRETALLDLGSGLLAQMPARELPDSDPPGKAVFDRIGEHFPLRITTINRDTQTVHVEHGEQPIVRLIKQGESERLEFKATLRRSPRTGEEDKGATFGVMKSIVGFLNSWDGGTLLVGIDDKGIPTTGPNDELGTLAIDRYTSEDEMIRALKDLIRRRIGASVFKWLTIFFTDFRNTRILRVDCEPADSEVWLKGGKSGTSNQEEFFLRTPAATDPLDGRELVNYIQRRFPTSPSEDN